MYRTYFKLHVTFSKFSVLFSLVLLSKSCVWFSLVLAFFISCNLELVCNCNLCYYDKKIAIKNTGGKNRKRYLAAQSQKQKKQNQTQTTNKIDDKCTRTISLASFWCPNRLPRPHPISTPMPRLSNLNQQFLGKKRIIKN